MALTIDDGSITSDRTAHTARRAPGQGTQWEVSWLPGRRLDRNSAITAMVLADVTTRGDVHEGHIWIHVEGWAAELGLTAPDVLVRTATEPQARPAEGSLPADPEAAG